MQNGQRTAANSELAVAPVAPWFRIAWVIEPGKKFDFSELEKLAGKTQFIFSGKESSFMQMLAIAEGWRRHQYNSEMDIVVPVGRVLAVWAAATAVGSRYHWLAQYCEGGYSPLEVEGS